MSDIDSLRSPTIVTRGAEGAVGNGGAAHVQGPAAQESRPVEAPADVPGKLLKAAIKRHEEVAALLARGPAALADSDFVHDLRVGSRRLGEVARLLAGFMDKPAAKAVEASLRSLRRSMGDLRDADVTREHLLKWRMPAPVKKIARDVAADLEQKRIALQAAAAAQITSASVTGTMVLLAQRLETLAAPERCADADKKLRGIIRNHLKKRSRQMRRAFGKAARKQTAASLHEARIAVKKLRYVLELADAAGTEKGAKKDIRFLKQLQELLGDHHDTHVIVEQLASRLRPSPSAPPQRRRSKVLAPAWRKWHRQAEHLQARRASDFFMRTYAWINS